MDLSRPFFSGIAGTGMSALAQFLALTGSIVSGSDRSLDRGGEKEKRDYFHKLNIRLMPQDGSGLEGCTCLIVSTAIEKQNPEVQKAQALGISIIHRSDLLAELARLRNTIAISGTSGKSTVTGMVYHILEAGGLSPSLITGANLVSLQKQGWLGNAKVGEIKANGHGAEWLVMEADESDGSLIKYSPEVGVILNVEKDHKEIAELIPLFKQFRDQTIGHVIVNGSDAHCLALKRMQDIAFLPDAIGVLNGVSGGGNFATKEKIENLILGDWDSTFSLRGVTFKLPIPGRHNISNAMAAITVGHALGIPLEKCAQGLANYQGVERRHILIGITDGEKKNITVVDDFAHNPAKVKACLETVKKAADGKPRRVLAIFHPHGFAPMKLLGKEMVESILEALGDGDHIYMPEIYYAGGTADKTISSADLIGMVNAGSGDFGTQEPARSGSKTGDSGIESKELAGHFFETKDDVIAAIVKEARDGDWIVSMGARDPSLGDFAVRLFDAVNKSL